MQMHMQTLMLMLIQMLMLMRVVLLSVLQRQSGPPGRWRELKE